MGVEEMGVNKDGNKVMKKSYPLVPSLSSWVQFFSKVSQIIIVVEVKERNQVLNRGNHCYSFKYKKCLTE